MAQSDRASLYRTKGIEIRGREGSRKLDVFQADFFFLSFFLSFFLFFTDISSRSQLTCTRHERAPFSWISIHPSPTVYIGCYRNGKFATLWKYRVTGLFLHAYVRFFFLFFSFFFSVCQWHGNNECYDWVKRSIEISVCFDL